MKALREVMQYQNKHVIQRYQKEYPNNKMTAETAFNELMKFFWLTHRHAQDQCDHPQQENLDFMCYVHFEMSEIDDMWHTFLLFTKDYAVFCNQYFGEFLHHQPNIDDEKPGKQRYQQELTRYVSYIYDHLGEQTVRTWFAELLRHG